MRTQLACCTWIMLLTGLCAGVQAAGMISKVGSQVNVLGSAAADTVHVRYVIYPGGPASSKPTKWIEVLLANTALQMETYAASEVDLIYARLRAGNDVYENNTNIASFVRGGLGKDQMFGGGSTDEFHGDQDGDLLMGRSGNDVLDGEDGDDRLVGGEGADFLVGGAGADWLEGNEDDDSLFGGLGDDDLFGGTGNDVADGGAGQDTVDGDWGRDLLIGGSGRDELDGGGDEDVIIGGSLQFLFPHESLNALWLEWTSNHSTIDRINNLLGVPHPAFGKRLNGNHFLVCGGTVDDDGAKDWISALDARVDLIFDGPFDNVVYDFGIDELETCL